MVKLEQMLNFFKRSPKETFDIKQEDKKCKVYQRNGAPYIFYGKQLEFDSIKQAIEGCDRLCSPNGGKVIWRNQDGSVLGIHKNPKGFQTVSQIMEKFEKDL